jgi:hypothetical protein
MKCAFIVFVTSFTECVARHTVPSVGTVCQLSVGGSGTGNRELGADERGRPVVVAAVEMGRMT